MRPKRRTLSKSNLEFRGVSSDMHTATIDDFQTYGEESLAAIKEFTGDYLENIQTHFKNNVGLILYGSNGVGKSFISNLITKEAYINRYTSMRVTFASYIQEYTRVWDTKTVRERERYEDLFYHNYKAVEFLILEEVGKELDTKLAPTVLEDCLRFREENGLPTIICSNLSLTGIAQRYGKSIASLIQGNMLDIEITGTDRRAEMFRERLE